ncbi:MAG TPA: hypothetical protein VER37_02335, partial [Thermomicrobiales bacterium]|nr:hypothetical protein [Thermomicrobiales bacterium]
MVLALSRPMIRPWLVVGPPTGVFRRRDQLRTAPAGVDLGRCPGRRRPGRGGGQCGRGRQGVRAGGDQRVERGAALRVGVGQGEELLTPIGLQPAAADEGRRDGHEPVEPGLGVERRRRCLRRGDGLAKRGRRIGSRRGG